MISLSPKSGSCGSCAACLGLAEGIGHHIAAERFARAGRKRQHEGSRQRAGGDAAGVKRDGRERARHKKAQCERDQITGNEEIQDRDARDDAQHRKAARGRDRDRQAHAHRLGGDRACAQLLDLLVECMHRGLRVDDEPAHQHRKRGEQIDKPTFTPVRNSTRPKYV